MDLTDKLRDIKARRLEAFLAFDHAGGSRDAIEAAADATTPEDIDTIHDAVDALDDYGKLVVELVKDVWHDFGRYRCSVCGMTKHQADAAGYDCAREC